MDPHLIFNVLQLLAILAIFAGIAWLLLRREPDRGRKIRWVVLAVAAIVALMLAISLMPLPFGTTRSDDASRQFT